MAKVVALIGGIALLVGVVVGFMPLHAHEASCGSAFVGSGDAAQNDLLRASVGIEAPLVDECTAAKDTWRPVALVFLFVGGALAATGGVSVAVQRQNELDRVKASR